MFNWVLWFFSFGKYVRFYVKKDDEPSSVSTPPPQLPNAFTILMAPPARNKKDELYNAIIDWVEEEGLAWSPSIECKTGLNTVRTLCDVLWYIDDHYSTLAERSCTIIYIYITGKLRLWHGSRINTEQLPISCPGGWWTSSRAHRDGGPHQHVLGPPASGQ